ncbi:hypothetical protein ISN45_At01g038050 [Arabidopsis thaliana x Arabidopsis arenosa]|uniref:Uncharacterized protein n=1 Tax=Arabidopsis thaliana x Arabidopsis arenosa TaxID=1240361 RepID=A0A8T2GNA1_9BRAS|nr:hypothetical protein ISN45_At01g038050 [Arabidopsis thaliana x Arabidopsis arenosa]
MGGNRFKYQNFKKLQNDIKTVAKLEGGLRFWFQTRIPETV